MNRRTFLSTVLVTASAPLVAGCNGGDGATASPVVGSTETRTPPTPDGDVVPFLDVPDSFLVETFVHESGLGGGEFRPGPEPGPRMLASHDGSLYVTVPSQGRVVSLPAAAESGRSAGLTTVVEDLDRPHGIAFHDDAMYLAQADSVVRFELDGVEADPASRTALVDDVPRGEFHWTRSIAVHEDRLYLSAGACTSGRCSAGNEAYLGAITAFDLDGSNPTTYASGLRNAVGIEWHDGRLFATDNGADDLGPDLPPDEVNVVREGDHYGWPLCYGGNVPDPERGEGEDACADKTPPAAELPPHCAPLGFDFYDASAFPADYRGDMYVALHGSWAREDPTGFEVVRIPYDEGTLGGSRTFVAGWMPEGGSSEDARGRPVDVHVTSGGNMFVSDDLSGTIYRVQYRG